MANSEFLEILSAGALEQLKEAGVLVKALADDIKKINNFKASKTPSGADKTIKDVNEAYAKQAKTIKDASNEVAKYTGNYNRLIQARDKSLKKLQDIIAKEQLSTKEINKAQAAYNALEAKVKSVYDVINNTKEKSTAKAIALAQKESDARARLDAKVLAAIQAQSEKQAKANARDSRTGASSPIPGMGGKIADLKETERLIALNARLGEAYNQLKAKRDEAERVLKNLIATEGASSAEIRKAQKEFDVLNKKVTQANAAVGKFSQSAIGLKSTLSGITSLMGAFGISTGLFLASSIAKDIYETTKALQSMNLALGMVSDGNVELARNQAFLKGIAEDYGIEIKGLTKNFTEFWVASKGKIEAEEIKGIFASISKSASVMGLSVQAQDSAFLALQQMMSKGTVQAEELKKQLGNALPGAIKAATQAYQVLHPEMKVTEKLFMEQMKAGKVVSSELLPELARQFEVIYGVQAVTRVETMQAAQERMSNAWTEWISGLSKGSLASKTMVNIMNTLAENIGDVANVVAIATTAWLAYKTAQLVAAIQTRILSALTALNTVEVANQTRAVGFQTAAQITNTAATNVATTAVQRFNLALKANALGLIVAGLIVAYQVFDYFNKSVEDTVATIKEANDAFITSRELTSEATIETARLAKRYEELSAKTKLTKDEQKELNLVVKQLAKEFPTAIVAVDRYGNALKINTETIKKYNQAKKTQLEIERKGAMTSEREAIAVLVKDIIQKKQLLKQFEKKKGEGSISAETIDAMRLEISMAEQQLILSGSRLVSLKSETEAQKSANKVKDETPAAIEKTVEWYDKEIQKLEAYELTLKDVTGTEGRRNQAAMKALKEQRDIIAGEPAKKEKKEKREKKKIDFSEVTSAIELRRAELEAEKEAVVIKMSNERNTFEQRLNLRSDFSAKSIAILDNEFALERAMINKKQLEDLTANQLALKNKDITAEERDKNIVDIAERTSNDLNRIEVEHSTKWNSLLNDDFLAYQAIQREKQVLTQETTDILIGIEKDKFDRIANDEEVGVRHTLATRQKAFDKFIELSKKELEMKRLNAVWDALGDEDKIANINAAYDASLAKINALISPTKIAQQETQKWMEGLTDGTLEKGLESLGLSSAKMFLDFDVNGQSSFMKLMEGAAPLKEKFAVAFQAIGDVAQDTLAIMGENSAKHFQAEYARLEKDKNDRMAFAGDSAAAKEKIERDYEKKKKEIQKREFKSKQKYAMANVAIDTAQAIIGLWAKPGFPAAAPMAIAIGALGALQLGVIASQKMPEYWRGTDNADAGYAWTQERGAEIVTDRKGNIKDFGSNQGAKLTMMEKGDKVYTAEQTSRMMFNNDLNSIMANSGISSSDTNLVVNAGLSKEEMRQIMLEALGSRSTQNINFDKNGFAAYISRNGNTTKRNESRGSGDGLIF